MFFGNSFFPSISFCDSHPFQDSFQKKIVELSRVLGLFTRVFILFRTLYPNSDRFHALFPKFSFFTDQYIVFFIIFMIIFSKFHHVSVSVSFRLYYHFCKVVIFLIPMSCPLPFSNKISSIEPLFHILEGGSGNFDRMIMYLT